MHSRLPALLLLPVLLLGCQRPPVVVNEQQRVACRREAEKTASPEEAFDLQATCLAQAIQTQAIQAQRQPTPAANPPAPAAATAPAASPPAQAPAPAADAIDRYLYCLAHRSEVQAASSGFTSAAKPWILAPKRYSPSSREYQAAKREYEAAVAELERLLPPEIRNGMDLLPTATRAFSRCDRQELEGPAGQTQAEVRAGTS
jgi:hypothetical protein